MLLWPVTAILCFGDTLGNDAVYLLAADAEDGGKLAVKAGFCGMFKIVVKIGHAAACTAEELAAGANRFDYLDESLGVSLADRLAVCLLAVLFNRNGNLLDFGNARKQSLRLLLRDKRTHNDLRVVHGSVYNKTCVLCDRRKLIKLLGSEESKGEEHISLTRHTPFVP